MFENKQFATKKSRETYERVLQTAIALFTEKGYQEATMRDVSKAAGLGLGALYYHFPSKEAIVLAFYQRLNQEVLAQWQPTPQGDPADQLARYVRLKLAVLAPYRSLMRVILKEAVDPESPLGVFHPASASTLDASVGVFEEVLAAHVPAAERQGLARLAWLGHLGLLAYWLHDPTRGAATERAVDAFAGLIRLAVVAAHVPGPTPLRLLSQELLAPLFHKPEVEDA
jgi:AcrR family transcriptional regulator